MESVFLCRPNKEIICELNGIDYDSGDLQQNVNNINTLSFTVNKYVNDENGELVISNGYDLLLKNMLIYLPSQGFFIIETPQETIEDRIYKTLSLSSIENELSYKNLNSFTINKGTTSSQENLVLYNDGETEPLLNPYTGLPYDYIVVKCTLDDVLRNFKNKYRNLSSFTDNNGYVNSAYMNEVFELSKRIPRLVKRQYEVDGKPISEEFMKFEYVVNNNEDVLNKIKLESGFWNKVDSLISFYSKYKDRLSLINLVLEKTNGRWSMGNIHEKYWNYTPNFDVDGTNIYSFLTQDLAKQLECIVEFDRYNFTVNITPVEEFGNDTGIIIGYNDVQQNLDVQADENFITRFYVSGGEGLNILGANYGMNYIDDISYFLEAKDSNGNNVYVSEELKNKYNTYKSYLDNNRENYINETKKSNELLSKYNEIVYRVPNGELSTDWTTVTLEEREKYLAQYKKLLDALISLYKDEYHVDIVDEEHIKTTMYWHDYYAYKKIIENINESGNYTYGNLSAESKEENIKKINSYKTEWTLYGTKELESKIKVYENNLSVLKEGKTLIFDENDNPIGYSNLDEASKNQINKNEEQYTISYNRYTKYIDELSACNEYYKKIKTEADNLYKNYEISLSNIEEINSQSRMETFKINSNSPLLFTQEDLQTLSSLFIDANYSSDNFFISTYDSESDKLDKALELIEDAKEQLSIESQPQYTFTSTIDNIINIEEYSDIIPTFKLGNFIYIEYQDGLFIKMRLISCSYNPFDIVNTLSVGFSNIIKSRSKRNDFTYLLDNASGSSSSSSGNSSGGSGSGEVGTDLNVAISNTMISQLLNSETFGTRVSDVILDTIDVNDITAKSATFGGLANGSTKVDGKCITTGVINSNKKDTTTSNPYTSLNLDDGTFSFANGKLKFDGSDLTVEQALNSGSINIGNGNFVVDEFGNMISKNANITGNITTTGGSIGGWNITESGISSSSGKAYIHKDGYVEVGKVGDDNTYTRIYDGDIVSQGLNGSKYMKIHIQNGGIHCMRPDSDKHRIAITSDMMQVIGVTDETNPINEKVLFNVNSVSGEWQNFFDTSYFDKDVVIIGNLDAGSVRSNGVTVSTTDHHHSSLSITSIDGGASFDAVTMVNRVNSTDNYALRPTVATRDSGYSIYLGSSSCRWEGIYLKTHENVFSDKNGKKDFTPFDSRYEEMYMDLKPTTYRMKDGTSGRIHSGFISQEVEEAMTNNNLTDMDFAAFCKDTDENGNDTYSLRYEEFIALNTHMIQKLYKKIETLEEEIAELKKQNS